MKQEYLIKIISPRNVAFFEANKDNMRLLLSGKDIEIKNDDFKLQLSINNTLEKIIVSNGVDGYGVNYLKEFETAEIRIYGLIDYLN